MKSELNAISLGPYQLLEQLAQGAYGEVYRARHVGPAGFQRILAVKRLKRHVMEDPAAVRAFENEARIGGLLLHHNIAQTLEFGEDNGHYYLAMEFIDGISFLDIISHHNRTRRTIPDPIALELIAQACDGLHYAHEAKGADGTPLKLVHRDIKPSNVMVSRSGVVKVMDFGIARVDNQNLTDAGFIKGTPRYLSPEVIARNAVVDRRSDLFSLGTVLYELLHLKPLFDAPNLLTLMARVREADVTAQLKELGKQHKGVAKLLGKVLTPSPTDRFQTAREMARELRHLRRELEKEEVDLETFAVTMLQEIQPEQGRVEMRSSFDRAPAARPEAHHGPRPEPARPGQHAEPARSPQKPEMARADAPVHGRQEQPRPQQSPPAARPEAQRPDAHRPEAQRQDAHRPEAQRQDAHRPEAQRQDAHRPEAQRQDAPFPVRHEVGEAADQVGRSDEGDDESSWPSAAKRRASRSMADRPLIMPDLHLRTGSLPLAGLAPYPADTAAPASPAETGPAFQEPDERTDYSEVDEFTTYPQLPELQSYSSQTEMPAYSHEPEMPAYSLEPESAGRSQARQTPPPPVATSPGRSSQEVSPPPGKGGRSGEHPTEAPFQRMKTPPPIPVNQVTSLFGGPPGPGAGDDSDAEDESERTRNSSSQPHPASPEAPRASSERATGGSSHAEPAVPVAAAKPADARPASEAKPVATAKPADARPASEVKPVTAAKPADARPASEAKPVTAAKPADARPASEAKPVAAAKPADARPASEAKPVTAAKPADARPASEVKPVTAAKPADARPAAGPSVASPSVASPSGASSAPTAKTDSSRAASAPSPLPPPLPPPQPLPLPQPFFDDNPDSIATRMIDLRAVMAQGALAEAARVEGTVTVQAPHAAPPANEGASDSASRAAGSVAPSEAAAHSAEQAHPPETAGAATSARSSSPRATEAAFAQIPDLTSSDPELIQERTLVQEKLGGQDGSRPPSDGLSGLHPAAGTAPKRLNVSEQLDPAAFSEAVIKTHIIDVRSSGEALNSLILNLPRATHDEPAEPKTPEPSSPSTKTPSIGFGEANSALSDFDLSMDVETVDSPARGSHPLRKAGLDYFEPTTAVRPSREIPSPRPEALEQTTMRPARDLPLPAAPTLQTTTRPARDLPLPAAPTEHTTVRSSRDTAPPEVPSEHTTVRSSRDIAPPEAPSEHTTVRPSRDIPRAEAPREQASVRSSRELELVGLEPFEATGAGFQPDTLPSGELDAGGPELESFEPTSAEPYDLTRAHPVPYDLTAGDEFMAPASDLLGFSAQEEGDEFPVDPAVAQPMPFEHGGRSGSREPSVSSLLPFDMTGESELFDPSADGPALLSLTGLGAAEYQPLVSADGLLEPEYTTSDLLEFTSADPVIPPPRVVRADLPVEETSSLPSYFSGKDFTVGQELPPDFDMTLEPSATRAQKVDLTAASDEQAGRSTAREQAGQQAGEQAGEQPWSQSLAALESSARQEGYAAGRSADTVANDAALPAGSGAAARPAAPGPRAGRVDVRAIGAFTDLRPSSLDIAVSPALKQPNKPPSTTDLASMSSSSHASLSAPPGSGKVEQAGSLPPPTFSDGGWGSSAEMATRLIPAHQSSPNVITHAPQEAPSSVRPGLSHPSMAPLSAAPTMPPGQSAVSPWASSATALVPAGGLPGLTLPSPPPSPPPAAAPLPGQNTFVPGATPVAPPPARPPAPPGFPTARSAEPRTDIHVSPLSGPSPDFMNGPATLPVLPPQSVPSELNQQFNIEDDIVARQRRVMILASVGGVFLLLLILFALIRG